jgi:hypothetical protein
MAPPSRPYPWKTFAFLVAAGTLTSPLVIPYFRGLEAIAPGPQPTVSLGTLYIRRGLEAVILSHFVIDVIVHAVRPIVEHGLA